MRRHTVVVGFMLLGCGGNAVAVDIEVDSPAIQDDRLAEAVGIETVGGSFTALLAAGCAIPCESTNTYSTAPDNPTELSLALYRGNDAVANRNHFLGRFTVSKIPGVPRSVPQVAITLRADPAGLHMTARDLSGGAIQLRQEY